MTVPADATGATQRIEVDARAGRRDRHAPARHPGHAQRRRRGQPDDRLPVAQGPVDDDVHVQPDPAQRHLRGPDLHRRRRPGPTAGRSTTQVSSESQAASALVKAGATTPVTVTAKPPAAIDAGQYPISVDVTSGIAHRPRGPRRRDHRQLLDDADDRRRAPQRATRRRARTTDLTLVVTNTGTAPITGVALSATPPSGWTVEFDPTTVDAAAEQPGQRHRPPDAVRPTRSPATTSSTFKATAPSNLATASADIRVTIETSLLWGAVGVGADRARAGRPVAGSSTATAGDEPSGGRPNPSSRPAA